ncbi:MAG TPA: response regulator transcription factor [Puia sp.]|jgi:DNA-binding response OmpR family regulator
MKNILLVEDDQQITTLLNLHLNSPTHTLTSCGRGQDALKNIERNEYDLIILDVMLPDISGLSICKKLRDQDNQTPIIMLTSRSDESDKVLALEMGADDYITKPFGVLELVARTKALLRRASPAETETTGQPFIEHGALHIDKVKRKVQLNGVRLDLTIKEFDLLYLLAGNPGKPYSRKDLLEIVWGFAFQGYEHTVTAHINRLRIKIEPDPNTPVYILTSWGIGYRFAE